MFTKVGVDEVGRGSWAGPLVFGAFWFKYNSKYKNEIINLLNPKDSKKLSKTSRTYIYEKINQFRLLGFCDYRIFSESAESITKYGLAKSIHNCLFKISLLEKSQPRFYLDGGLKLKNIYKQKTIIGGDNIIPEIAIASIISKTHRDIYMSKIKNIYKNYAFDLHVGYGTKLHIEEIEKFGLTHEHRKNIKRFVSIA